MRRGEEFQSQRLPPIEPTPLKRAGEENLRCFLA